jgi:hypothetical protein
MLAIPQNYQHSGFKLPTFGGLIAAAISSEIICAYIFFQCL